MVSMRALDCVQVPSEWLPTVQLFKSCLRVDGIPTTTSGFLRTALPSVTHSTS